MSHHCESENLDADGEATVVSSPLNSKCDEVNTSNVTYTPDSVTLPMENEPHVGKFVIFYRNLNFQYGRQYRGIFNILQVIVGVMIVGLFSQFCRDPERAGFHCHQTNAFIVIVASACLICSVFHIACHFASLESSLLISKTIYEPLHYVLSIILYFTSSISLIVQDLPENTEEGLKIAGAVLGFFNTFLFGVCALHYRLHKSEAKEIAELSAQN